MVNESKIECTHRLRRAQLWTEASLFRDQVRRRLRAEGMSKKEAGEAAWTAMQQRFPAEDPPLVAALVRGILDPPHSPQTQEEITQIWFAVHVLQALSLYRDLPSEQQPWARYRISTDRTFNLLARLHTQSLYDPLEISP